jgi:predicted membrane channel-forming protein YqfA (hemolysin III family)
MTVLASVMSGELGDIFWDLAPYVVYSPGYDIGCNIYVANPTDQPQEYVLMAKLTNGTTVISEEAGLIGASLLILLFVLMGYVVKQREMGLVSSLVLMVLGFIIMILAPILISIYELAIIIMAILGGLLTVLGAIFLVPRRKTA